MFFAFARFLMLMLGLVFSLIGKNRWLEIPKNPSASYLICGGSSSGGAIAAASDVVDFALGEVFFNPASILCLLFCQVR